MYITHAERQIDRIERRVLCGEKIPHEKKVFSIFEPHTCWISKGEAGRPVELGVPVCIMEDHHGFILNHKIMREGSDTDYAAPMVESSQKLFYDLRTVSFDCGFHSPENRIRLEELFDHNALPKKGRLNRVEREREQG